MFIGTPRIILVVVVPSLVLLLTVFNWHCYKAHGMRHEIRTCVRDTICVASMRDFHSRERLIVHIAASAPKCRRYYYEYVEPVPLEEVAILEQQALEQTRQLFKIGYRKTKAFDPPQRIRGPLVYEALCIECQDDNVSEGSRDLGESPPLLSSPQLWV